MNLMGTKVKHKKFGEGEIVSVDDFDKNNTRLKVQFASIRIEFSYPSCFEKFIEVIDEQTSATVKSIVDEYNLKKQQEREERVIERKAHVKAISTHIKSKSIFTDDFSKIERGYVYGTNSRIIYEKFCETLGWDISKANQFGMVGTPLYAANCDIDKTSDVWFIFHANYDLDNLNSVVDNFRVIDLILDNGDRIIEHFTDGTGESNNAHRITFVRTDKGYEFLGVYEIIQNGTSRLYKRISTTYPIKK